MEPIFTVDELQRFFSEKSADMDCPACKRDTWLADIPHQDHQTLQRWSNVVESDRGARLRVILVCAHCGFVREHDAQAVLNWKEDGNG